MYVNELTCDYGDEGRSAVRELLRRGEAIGAFPEPVRVDFVLGPAVVLSAVRTPVGRYGEALSGMRPDDLAATTISAAVERAGVPTAEIEDVCAGCADQAGEDNRNVARMAALLAGLPERGGVMATGSAPRGASRRRGVPRRRCGRR